ncbi:ImmA/IrrE family metallo-endopeptidase [Metabacillus fastidiosus]|nr:ImmA/IrrE family metallo-endopeptidase [Metabacillus fastidiosus]MED4461814.1 hypothetical protein [Metabacillus fastidiosus]
MARIKNETISENIKNFDCMHELEHAILHPKVNTFFKETHPLSY